MHSSPPSPPAVHCAVPVPAVAPGQTWPQLPQLSTDAGFTQAPPQSSDVVPLHPRPHVPFVHVAIPLPESGPSHTLLQVPQCAGFVGSTHVPLQSSVIGGEQLASTPASRDPVSAEESTMLEPPESPVTMMSSSEASVVAPESAELAGAKLEPPQATDGRTTQRTATGRRAIPRCFERMAAQSASLACATPACPAAPAAPG